MWLIFDVDKVNECDEFIVVLIFFASRVEVYSYFNNFEIYLFPQVVKIQTYPISGFYSILAITWGISIFLKCAFGCSSWLSLQKNHNELCLIGLKIPFC